MVTRLLFILLTFSMSAFSQETLEGTIYFGIEDDFEGNEMREFVDFKDAKTGKISELTFKNGKIPPGIQMLKSGDKIKIRGRKNPEQDLVQYDGSSEPELAPAPMEDLRSVPKVSGGGSRTALVVRVNLIDQGQYSCNSEADLQSRIFSSSNPTSGYNVFKDNSYGAFDFTGKVVTVNVQKRTTDYSCTNSDLTLLSEDANAVLVSQGIDPYAYDYQQYYIPSNIPCSFGGRAYLGANLGWVRTCSDKTPVHEFGHNFGMGHADSTNSSNYSGYGDYSDFMGLRYYELNAPHRDQLGWIPSTQVETISTSTKANFKLASLSAATSSNTYLQALKFPHTDTGDQIYFSYRTAVGSWDSSISAEYKDLLSVHRRDSLWYNPTMHLQSLGVGEVYTDSKTGITVEVISKNSTYMEVAVNGGGESTTPTDSEAPTLSITSPQEGDSFYAGKTISASASASDNVGVAKVEFYLDGALKCTDLSSAYSCSILAPSSAGTAKLMVVAYDAAGNAKSQSISLNILEDTTDTTAPSVSISSPANGASYEVGSTVSVTVAASDNVGVASVQVWHEGYWHYATQTSSGYSYSFPMTENSTSIRAMAKDEAGNQQLSDFVSLSVKTSEPTDTQAPTAPSSLSSRVKGKNNVELSWRASSDNVGVTGYKVYRDGSLIGETADLGFQEKGPSGSSVYTVKAFDAAGNLSASSNSVTVTIGGGGDGGGGGKGGGKPEKDGDGTCKGNKCK